MRNLILFLFALFIFVGCNIKPKEKTLKDSYSLEFNLNDFPNKVVYLADFYGDKNKIIDSVKTNKNGNAKFIFFTKASCSGFYRLIFSNEKFLDIIFDREDIWVTTSITNPFDSARFIKFNQNEKYYDFLKQEKNFQKKVELLLPLIDNYPKEDPFYISIENQFKKNQIDIDRKAEDIIAEFPNSFLSKVIKSKKMPIIDDNLNPIERKEYIKAHFFDNVDFSDSSMIHSPVFTSKSISFLTLFSDKNLPKAVLENNFIKASDIILSKAKVNQKVFEQVLDYLMRGFEEFQFNKVLNHLSNKYKIESSCENSEGKTTLKRRLDSFQKLAIGKKVPEIRSMDVFGKEVSLSKVKSEYTLIVFWASWCPHCEILMPELRKLYNNQINKNLEIIGVSIDSSKTKLLEIIKKERYSWINVCDSKGWNGKIAEDYCIYATPTMFLLDSRKIILAKPISLRDLSRELGNLKVK
jgi:peroxiredoxin